MKKIKLPENMKSSSWNKHGMCSMQMIMILMIVILMSSFILDSTNITLKIISKRENTIQEQLWGESIFQIVDLYMIQGVEKIYNNPQKSVFISSYDNDKIKIKILQYALSEILNTNVIQIGNKLSGSRILEDIGLEYKYINRIGYVYDNSPEVKCFVKNKEMVTNNIYSSEDFAMIIAVKIEKGNDTFVYYKDYFLKIPMYTDELINEIKTYYEDNSNSKPWVSKLKFDIEATLITSEVYYDKN
ncbi:MAG: hypothetical protein WBH44_09415 [Proteocatella sp.]